MNKNLLLSNHHLFTFGTFPDFRIPFPTLKSILCTAMNFYASTMVKELMTPNRIDINVDRPAYI